MYLSNVIIRFICFLGCPIPFSYQHQPFNDPDLKFVPQLKNNNQRCPARRRIQYKSTKQPPLILPLIQFESTKQSTPIKHKSTKQPTLVGRENESPCFKFNSGENVDKGDSEAKKVLGDLIDFKSDVTYFPKTEDSRSKSKRAKADHIEFLTEDVWPAGQAPQVKRKLEHPNYQTVTAHLISTETGAKIVVKGGLISEGILISVRSSKFPCYLIKLWSKIARTFNF